MQCGAQIETVILCRECLGRIGLQVEQPGNEVTRAHDPPVYASAPDVQELPREVLRSQFPHFHVLGVLGTGELTAVYKVHDRRLNDRLVALKVLSPVLGQDQSVVSQFLDEARVHARLIHTRVVALREVASTSSGLYYSVIEFVDGHNLREFPDCSSDEWKLIIAQIGEALRYGHTQGVAIQGLTPKRVLIDRRKCVKLSASAIRDCRLHHLNVT